MGDTSDLENYQIICLLNNIYKFVTRIGEEIELLSTNSTGFQQFSYWNDHLYGIKTVIKNSMEYNIPLVLVFIDFKTLEVSVPFTRMQYRLPIHQINI